jgi:hypothetical protein
LSFISSPASSLPINGNALSSHVLFRQKYVIF